jgi:ABC-type dipeptide/oligopeptide/nickel transport system ATPase component
MIPAVNDNPVYNQYKLSEYAGNPLIEALRPPPETTLEATERLLLKPLFKHSDIDLSKAERKGCIDRLSSFMFPMQKQVKIFQSVYDQTFSGLTSRNPFSFIRHVDQYGSRKMLPPHHPIRNGDFYRPAKLSLIVGLSGVGKTALCHAIMRAMGENIIRHKFYNGQVFTDTQITYLHTDVPKNCSATNLCGQFIAEVDSVLQSNFYSENYHGKYIPRGDYLKQFKRIIGELHVGVLFVDEFQNLSIGKSGGREDLIAFLVNIRDKLGMPTIFVGTNKVAQLLTSEMALVRRLLEGGIHHIDPFKSPNDKSWGMFCEATWNFQWVKHPSAFSSDICHTLFEYSAGIPALMLDLFQKSQKAAIDSGGECVDLRALRNTYHEEMRDIHILVDGVKQQDTRILDSYEDIFFEIKSKSKADQKSENAVQGIVKAIEKSKQKAKSGDQAIKNNNNEELRAILSADIRKVVTDE